MEQLGSHWTHFDEILCLRYFSKICRENSSSIKIGQERGYFTWIRYIFLIMSSSVLLRMRNVLDKSCRGNQNTDFVFSTVFSSRKSLRLWDNVEKYFRAGRAQMTIPKGTNTHSEYVILIAFPLQQWLHGRFSVLRYTHIICFVLFYSCL